MTVPVYWRDLGERVASSFAAGFLATGILESADVFHADWKAALLAGAAVAVVSAVKGLLARFVGFRDSASIDPKV